MTPREVIGGPVEPRLFDHLALQPLEAGTLRFEGGFWGERQVLNREVTIPHGTEMLEEWGSLDNLRAAAGRSTKEYRLPLFMDSDVYKVLEAIAWERQHGVVAEQERFFADTVDLLAAAQGPDGYINSYVQVVRADKRFGDPAMGHELYCAGHLFQAAVAEARSGVRPARTLALGDVADRFATYLLTAVPEMPSYVDGHPEVETALVERYRQQGHTPLLAMAEDIIGRRGHAGLRWATFHSDYFQDDVAVVDTKAIRGHAVRALYLLSGVADTYIETGREELLRSCLAQWEDMVGGKTYLTGGVGSRHESEAFGDRYELPPDRAYCETCAAIASIMWNWRMCLITGEARFAELFERTLYNSFLSGWGLDGKTFFYVNPLQSRGGVTRQRWYRCACCPPNLMRLVASLEHYVATRTRDGLQLHQFMPCRIDAAVCSGRLRARLQTGYPYDGSMVLVVEQAPPAPMDLALRAPSWSPLPEAELNGAPQRVEAGADGYLHLRRTWRAGDELSVQLSLRPRVVRAVSRIDALRGCFALERGPLVYCFEPGAGTGLEGSAPTALEGLYGAPGQRLTERRSQVGPEAVVELVVAGRQRPEHARTGWPYVEGEASDVGTGRELDHAAVPYYTWCNRGPSEMRVWLPEARPQRLNAP